MSSAQEELGANHQPKFWAAEHGIVVDNVDPLGLHRVRVEIPGIMERSPWAFPLTAGGGAPGRGASTVPAIGSSVVVFFVAGDLEVPVYAGGWWGRPPSGPTEMSEEARVATADAHLIQLVHESSRLKIWVDERPGREQLAIQDKVDGDVFLQIDMSAGTLTISATAGVILKSFGAIALEATQITLNGRNVLADNKAI